MANEMNTKPRSETAEAWDAVSRTPDGMYDSRVPISQYAYAMAEHSRKMEHERDAARAAASEALTQNPMENQTDRNAPPVPLARLVERWVETAIRVQDTFGKIENAFMASPENKIRSAIWDMFGEYTRTLAAQLSDDAEDARGWLEWFAWECDFGRKPMEMVFSDGETLLVVGASDLLAAIRTDENGRRVWPSPLNA